MCYDVTCECGNKVVAGETCNACGRQVPDVGEMYTLAGNGMSGHKLSVKEATGLKLRNRNVFVVSGD